MQRARISFGNASLVNSTSLEVPPRSFFDLMWCVPEIPFTTPDSGTPTERRDTGCLNNHDLGFVHQVLTFVRRQPGARIQFSRNANTMGPEMISFLIRYGPAILSADEYRRLLRRHLRGYVSFHVRQLPRPSRLRQAEFFGLHRAQVARILEEAGEDAEVRLAMRAVEAMLRRRTRAVPDGAGLP